MEERKKHPSLPSNYLTLAQLQERWLKQQNQINQPQPQSQEQQNQQPPNHNHHQHLQPHQEVVVAPRNGTASSSSSRLQKQYVAKNRNDSETRRRAIEVAVASVDNRKSESIAGIGDETSDLNGKVSESKNKWNRRGKWKTKTEKRVARGEGSGTAAQGNEAAEKKATIENELKEEKKKSGGSETVEEIVEQRVRVLSIMSGNEKKKNGGSVTAEEVVEQSVRVLSINSGNGKQNNEGLGKMNNNSSGTAAQGGKEAKKTTIENDIKEKKNELKEKEKKNSGSLTVEEVEQKVRVSSNSSGNVKQNGGLGKMNNGFRHSQSQRKYYGGEASYGYGYGYGNLKVGVQRTTKKKMVWVKKEEIVGGIET